MDEALDDPRDATERRMAALLVVAERHFRKIVELCQKGGESTGDPHYDDVAKVAQHWLDQQ